MSDANSLVRDLSLADGYSGSEPLICLGGLGTGLNPTPVSTSVDSFAGISGLAAPESLTSAPNDGGALSALGAPVVSGADNVDDVLNGSDDADQLFGLSGNDTLYGAGGGDELYGGADADLLYGGAGADRFIFESVSDSHQSSQDIIGDFEVGSDLIDFSHLGDIRSISMNRGAEGLGTIIYATTANGQVEVGVVGSLQAADVMLASGMDAAFGFDVVGLDGLDEQFMGSSGADRLFGFSGDDRLEGGAGDDQLFGDAGADRLIGGAGADHFSYRSIGDSTAASQDIIQDFQVGIDKIDLSYVKTDVTTFKIEAQGDDSLVTVDVDGDGVADLSIFVHGALLTNDDVYVGAQLPPSGVYPTTSGAPVVDDPGATTDSSSATHADASASWFFGEPFSTATISPDGTIGSDHGWTFS